MRRHCAWHSSGAGWTAQPLCFQPALPARQKAGGVGWAGAALSSSLHPPLPALRPTPRLCSPFASILAPQRRAAASASLAMRHCGSPLPRGWDVEHCRCRARTPRGSFGLSASRFPPLPPPCLAAKAIVTDYPGGSSRTRRRTAQIRASGLRRRHRAR